MGAGGPQAFLPGLPTSPCLFACFLQSRSTSSCTVIDGFRVPHEDSGYALIIFQEEMKEARGSWPGPDSRWGLR